MKIEIYTICCVVLFLFTVFLCFVVCSIPVIDDVVKITNSVVPTICVTNTPTVTPTEYNYTETTTVTPIPIIDYSMPSSSYNWNVVCPTQTIFVHNDVNELILIFDTDNKKIKIEKQYFKEIDGKLKYIMKLSR